MSSLANVEHYVSFDDMFMIVIGALLFCANAMMDASLHCLIQWELICGKKWIVSLIITVQMVGVLAGAAIVGQLGKWLLHAPTYTYEISTSATSPYAIMLCLVGDLIYSKKLKIFELLLKYE